ncbi:MAG TPA: class I SAM-dependent methyltransferase [Gammaproteobacteria bacterium]
MNEPAVNLEPDAAAAAQFAERLLKTLNDGALCLMISIGHRTGLFDTMSTMAPSTSAEIAARAGLDERYVREWLGAMVTSGIVEYAPQSGRYALPREHAASLTRAAGADNIGVFAQYIGTLASVETDIVECFRNGGGVPYEKYPRFHEVMAEDSGQSVLSSLETHILPLVPGLVARLEQGITVLDLGCGRGLVLKRLAELFPRSRFKGIDLSSEAVAFANAQKAGLDNVEYVVRDLSDFDRWAEPAAYDLVTTFDAIHDQARPLNVLRGIYRTLKDDGVYLMQDIRGSGHHHTDADHPLGTLLYTVSCMHCMTVSLAQGGEGLGAMWGEPKAREYLSRAGFRTVETHRLAHDIQNNWYVVRK